MDNLTHSLTGAVIGQLGLKRKTGLAMPTLIIGANLPDIDAVTTLLGTPSLALRRGLTHGPIALLLLPLVLTALMLAWDRWQGRRGRRPAHRPPVRAGWLLALAYIGTLSHPLLDWFNSYGIRLLEPFSSHWFAANTLFIIDVWLWAALIVGVWWPLRRERRGHAGWRAPAMACVAAVGLYVAANGLISERAQRLMHVHVERDLQRKPTLVVANPVPLAFWQRRMLWRDERDHGYGNFELPGRLTLERDVRPHGLPSAALDEWARLDEGVRAYLFWSRMPVVTAEEGTLVLRDQRFMHPLAPGSFTLRQSLPK
jgi:inner membrane protein